jgi:surface protein
MKNFIYLFLALIIVACSSDDGNPCVYNPTLTTSAVTNITETSATLNGVISIVSENCEDPTNTEQGFVYATTIQPTTNNTQVNVNGTNITTTLENLEPNTTYYARTFLTNALGDFYGNEVSFLTTDEPVNCDNVVYLAENGITIKACEDANVGDTGVIDDVTYTVVDEAMLRTMVVNGEDVTTVVTTKVRDMSVLFFIDAGVFSDFNQDISSWDVSNVSNMRRIFANCFRFNQPIGNWDVSHVFDMEGVFWDCDDFNQPIGDWDVSNVTDMRSVFYGAHAFNQPLNNWDVSNVTRMQFMFVSTYAFNQDISDWDVSSVTNMTQMFRSASAFNQDLSSWNIGNVSQCEDFAVNTPQWTLPKPNLFCLI